MSFSAAEAIKICIINIIIIIIIIIIESNDTYWGNHLEDDYRNSCGHLCCQGWCCYILDLVDSDDSVVQIIGLNYLHIHYYTYSNVATLLYIQS